MQSSTINNNADDLIAELDWLGNLLHQRLYADKRITKASGTQGKDIYSIKPPDHSNSDSAFATFIDANKLSFEERVLLALALAPHLKPEFLDIHVSPSPGLQLYEVTDFVSAILGTRGSNYKGLLPTGLTYLYILAGTDIRERLRLQNLLSKMAKPALMEAIRLQPHNSGEPAFSGRIVLMEKYLELFTVDEIDKEASIKYAFKMNPKS